jgi:hypothetical protein
MQEHQYYDGFFRWYQCHGSIFVDKRQCFDCDFVSGQNEEGDIIMIGSDVKASNGEVGKSTDKNDVRK